MKTACLFRNGQSQAARLPKEYRSTGDRVLIKRVGDAVVLLPEKGSWTPLFESLSRFPKIL
jgi:antitoxin VapB